MAASRRKRPRVAAAYTGEFWDGDSLDWTRTSVLDNGLIVPKINSKAKLKPPSFPEANAAAENLYALNTLQQRENSPVNDSIMLYSLQAMLSYLPKGVSDMIHIGEQPGEDTDFGELVTDDQFDKNLPNRWKDDNPLFRNMKLGPYFFWPINTGNNHYVTLIMVLGQNMVEVDNRKDLLKDPANQNRDLDPVPFYQVNQWSIVDPKRGNIDDKGDQTDGREYNKHLQRVQRVRKRVRAILGLGGIHFDFGSIWKESTNDQKYSWPWVPPQKDDWSSGVRSFALIKKQCDAILEAYSRGTSSSDDSFWGPSSGWLNPHQIRHEMMGLLAVNCIRDMRWKARIAIEPIEELDGVRTKVKFPARNLRPRELPPVYAPQREKEDGDQMLVSAGYDPDDSNK